MSALDKKHFHDEIAAYRYVEERLWPEGPVCPRCGRHERIGALKGKSTRVGVSSHLPLRHWLQAIFLMASSKKGISTNQLHRMLGCTLKTAWFLSHRIREAMRGGQLSVFGAGGGTVEVDETFIGKDRKNPPEPGKQFRIGNMNKVLSLVDRETGQARSYVVNDLTMKTILPILEKNISKEARLMTDEAKRYKQIGWNFSDHGVVNHSKGEYRSNDDHTVHTNTIEGFFSIFKRGMRGIYQHCDQRHLHRYTAEFDFRYSNRKALGVDDTQRADNLLKGVTGKRLTYQTARSKGRADAWQRKANWAEW